MTLDIAVWACFGDWHVIMDTTKSLLKLKRSITVKNLDIKKAYLKSKMTLDPVIWACLGLHWCWHVKVDMGMLSSLLLLDQMGMGVSLREAVKRSITKICMNTHMYSQVTKLISCFRQSRRNEVCSGWGKKSEFDQKKKIINNITCVRVQTNFTQRSHSVAANV